MIFAPQDHSDEACSVLGDSCAENRLIQGDSLFVLSHVHVMPSGHGDVKLIGIYRSLEMAQNAKTRSSVLPGFREALQGFNITEYAIGKDYW